MSYTAFTFIIFMLVTMLLYFIMPRRARWGVLLAASYLFYFFVEQAARVQPAGNNGFGVSIGPGARADQYAIPFGQKTVPKEEKKALRQKTASKEKIGCIFGGAL